MQLFKSSVPHKKAEVISIDTRPYEDQKPGTSGLRKVTGKFQQTHYVENFIQATYNVIQPKTVLVGGDGRYLMTETIHKIILVLVANGVEKIIIPLNGLVSTPAASGLIREHNADMGIILTASHNPGGPTKDFGIKINTETGAPATEIITGQIFEATKRVKSFKTLEYHIPLPLDHVQTFDLNQCKMVIMNGVTPYVNMMSQCFDLKSLGTMFRPKEFKINDQPFKIIADGMNGIAGPYISEIISKQLHGTSDMFMNVIPKEDFGGLHPDPNLTYAKHLVEHMKAQPDVHFGISFDGDADRNMVLGEGGFFVSPCDALAILADNIDVLYQKGEPKNLTMRCKCEGSLLPPARGFARSFPTAPAVDRVCKKKGYPLYETPTGWKFFGELLDYRLAIACGEESFGLGGNHIREKDGVWAFLCWLSIMKKHQKSIRSIVEDHWREYGRDYFNRFDFENCDAVKCNTMIEEFEKLIIDNQEFIGRKFGLDEKYEVIETGNFEYTSPISGEKTLKQGLYIKFSNDSRIIVRLSGTGSQGATVRIYLNSFSRDDISQAAENYHKELLKIALELTKICEHTGREKPDVVT